MASSPTELDYTTIDRPYDGSLNRATSEAQQFGSPSLLQGSADPTGNGASVNPNNKTVASGTEFADVWLNTWIKSKNYLPKTRGFFIDAMAGYIEAMNVFISGDVTASTGSIGGFVIGADYIRDLADSFGLASTVTGGDDVRFWAGAAFASRSSAPLRITEAGALVASSATISGSITATSGSIGGFTISATAITATNLILDSSGQRISLGSSNDIVILDADDATYRLWTGHATAASAPFSVSKTGALVASSATITGALTAAVGSVISGTYITDNTVTSAKVNASIRSWNVTCAFSASDSDTVAWGSGSLILSDGTSYSIAGSNTGNMSARTYIYFDSAVSTTAFQTTTTASTAVGDGKILVATAVNNTNEATFEVFGGVGGMNVDGSSIVALSITGSEIAANTITANKLTVSQLSAISADLGSITAGTIVLPSGGYIRSGQTAYDTGTGFYIGNDAGTPKFSIGNSSGDKLTWSGTALSITGSLTATTGTIGGFTIGATTITATNLTLDSSGQRISLGSSNDIVILDADDATYRLWTGHATAASAPFSVSKTGALVASSATITGALTAAVGSVISGTYLTDNTVTSAKVNVAARGWTQTCAFSASDSDTVAWGSGTFTASDGTSYSITGSNTGNMAAKTYIYLDTGVSTTAYQTTTTATSAVGDGRVLVAVAQNNTTEATFQVFGGNGGMNIDASSIVASSITANEIAASTITAGKLSISTLSAITANMGTITAGTITIDTSGYIRGGQTDYNTGTGFFLGYSGAAYKLSIGDATTSNSLTWDGSILTVNGSTVSGNDIFGSGVDGAFALDGTNTYATYMSKSGSDYTLIKDVYATTFTMSSSATLTTNGYRLFCKTSLTTGASNVIKWNGNNANNGAAGTPAGASGMGGGGGSALSSANLFGGIAGSAGGDGGAALSPGTAGTAGTNVTNTFNITAHTVVSGSGGTGGADGTGTPGSSGGASGAAGSLSSASSVRPYSAAHGIRMYDELPGSSLAYLRYQAGVGGAGGGGGGDTGCIGATGGSGGGGGGSGSSGGTIVICARTISHAGSITATGGNGGNGGNGAYGLGGAFCGGGGHGGGGGGGGGAGSGGPGGIVMVIYSSLSGAGTITAAGGAPGSVGSGGAGGVGTAGGGNGANGSSGNAGSTGPSGVVIQLVV